MYNTVSTSPFSEKFLSFFVKLKHPVHTVSQYTVLCKEISVKSELCGWDVMFSPSAPQLKRLRVTVARGSDWHCSFSAILCWDGQQQVLLSVECRVTQWCCFGKGGCSAARWQLLAETVMALCFLQELQHQLPLLPLQPTTPYPILMALTPALTPASPRAGSAYEHVCVRSSSGCVRRPRPIRLASTDVTGLEEC